MNQQDLKVTVLKKKGAGMQTETIKKDTSGKNTQTKITANLNKLEADRDPSVEVDYKHKMMPSDVGKEIQKARDGKNLSRKQLASQLSVKEKAIEEIENGKGVYNGNLISKIKRVLGMK